ncbi:MAG: CBS domain-containing protein [Actinomycetota bacterium]
MLVRDVMTHHPARIHQDDHLQRAAELAALSMVSDLMVVDEDGRFVGVLSEGDILRALMPAADEIDAEGGTVAEAFAVFDRRGERLRGRDVATLVIRDPMVIRPDDHVAAAAAVLLDRMIRRLPVVEDGKLVGTVSRADILRAAVGTL